MGDTMDEDLLGEANATIAELEAEKRAWQAERRGLIADALEPREEPTAVHRVGMSSWPSEPE